MIVHIENEIFTKLKNALPLITVYPSYPETAPKFPCVIFEELTKTTKRDTVDSSGEKHNNISFQIEVYTQGDTKKSDAVPIIDIIDSIMSGFYRMNRDDARAITTGESKFYRYVMRYSAVVSSDKIYRQ